MADVVLPLASYGEVDGTFTNSERRVQPVNAACGPAAGITALELLAALGRASGLAMDATDPGTVRKELAEVVREGRIATWALDEPGGRWSPRESGPLAPAVRGDGPASVFFHPRWTDAAETLLSLRVEEAGLPAFVVGRAGV
jgi:formate dehydrogenase major subunit